MRTTAQLQAERQQLIDQAKQVQQAGIDKGTLEIVGNHVYGVDGQDNGHVEKLDRLDKKIRALGDQIRKQQIRDAADQPAATIPPEPAPGAGPGDHLKPGQRRPGPDPTAVQRQAHNAVERLSRHGQINTADADRLSSLVVQDVFGTDAAYIAAVADPAYETAFAKALLHGSAASLRMETVETDAMRATLRAAEIRAAYNGGGYAAAPIGVGGGTLPLPITVDPTVQLTGGGTISPLRQDANVITISTPTYKLGTSAGMTAEFAEEGEEVADSTPEIDPAEIRPERAHAFGEFTIEAGQDWSTIQTNLVTMLQEAKATLEATKFLAGAGETAHEPQGLLTDATEFISESNTLTLGDLIAMQDDLTPRYQPGARWYGNLATRNQIDQLVAQADPAQAKVTDDTGSILHRPYRETSDLPAAAAGQACLIYGDLLKAFRIVDRVGMSIEVIPHMMGANGRPRGVRGLYAIWRTTSRVVDPAAVRVLKLAS